MDEPVDIIREFSRAALSDSRRAQREDATNSRRKVVEEKCRHPKTSQENITPAVIPDIANRLKTKTAVSAAELRTLKNSILDDPHHIQMVLNTQGALRGLVRELTGQDARRALQAAGCLCNLSLGDNRACAAIARSAGPYLVAALSSQHDELATTCAWALGSLAPGGAARAVLAAQGAARALAAALAAPPGGHLGDAAASALAQLARCELGKEHASGIIQALSRTRLTQANLQLLFVLSCREDFDELLDETFLQNLLEHSTRCIDNVSDNLEFLYAIRVLANITLNDNIYRALVSHFSVKVDDLRKILVMNNDVVKSLLWFLGNLYNYNCDHEFFNKLLA